MALPRIVVRGKEIILLSGFKDEAKETNEFVCGVVVDDEVKLQQAAKRNPDAVHGLQHCRDEPKGPANRGCLVHVLTRKELSAWPQ